MPTGYTAAVADGKITTLRDFALYCARGMGALITMRDEPLNAPIPETLEPSTTYYDNKLAALRAELGELEALTDEQVLDRMEAERQKAIEYRAEYKQRDRVQRERYEAMIAQVAVWTTEAEGIRDFMLQPLRESLKFDFGGSYEPPIPPPMTAGEWLNERSAKLAKEISYHEGERDREIARTADRNAWLKALRDSLPSAELVGQT